ncbi:MAG: NUDIX hydrolase [Halovenus sp.]|uniref:NUDIX hydrolase n=1 Tax=Halovenus amylolytica TaxID=2500550 RepID=UPI000FE2A53C
MSSQIAVPAQNAVPFRRGAKALITAGSRVLLVKERHSDGAPFWTLPGGGVEGAESKVTALRRELAEELRCQATVGQSITHFWYSHTSVDKFTLCTVFDCSLLSSLTPNLGEGIYDMQWARPGELPASTLLQVRHVVETCCR